MKSTTGSHTPSKTDTFSQFSHLSKEEQDGDLVRVSEPPKALGLNPPPMSATCGHPRARCPNPLPAHECKVTLDKSVCWMAEAIVIEKLGRGGGKEVSGTMPRYDGDRVERGCSCCQVLL